jgi:hypothetical protein
MIQEKRERGYREIKVKSNFQFSKTTYSQIAFWHATPKQKGWNGFLDEQYGEERDTKRRRSSLISSIHRHRRREKVRWLAGLDLKETNTGRRK